MFSIQKYCCVLWVFSLLVLVLPSTCSADDRGISSSRPNVLLIVADDLGYTDLGAFGSEIETPTLDRLAMEGLRFTNFTAAASCSPTRAMLMSGTDHHTAGLGNMIEKLADNQRGKPGYEGYLSARIRTVASLLSDSGYLTYISGKWHLGGKPDQLPSSRGFSRSFVLLQGAAGHFDDTGPKASIPISSFRDGKKPADWPKEKYSTDYYTDRLLGYLDERGSDDTPFFAYLAYTAPHWPLQAPKELIEQYKGRYDDGWDALKSKRLERMRELDSRAGEYKSVKAPTYVAWDTLSSEEKAAEARKMEVYAAMVDSMDDNVARVIEKLKEHGDLENTIIIFLSDNGPEAKELSKAPDFGEHVAKFDNSLNSIGSINSFTFTGPGWASASNAYLRSFKGSVAEGGTRVPAFFWDGRLNSGGHIVRQPLHVKDIAPTILEAAGVHVPRSPYEHAGIKRSAMTGKSFLPLIENELIRIHDEQTVFATELFGRRAVRTGDWKLVWEEVPWGKSDWELFNLKDDPGETRDLALKEPKILKELIHKWEIYEEEVGVIIPNELRGY
jgi:arylsulfatase